MERTYPTRETRIEEMMRQAYGPFVPGSTARHLRVENARRGLRTCYNPDCLTAYKPVRFRDDDGKLHRLGTGRYYCSRACAWSEINRDRADRAEVSSDPDDFVLDLTDYEGAA